MYGKIAALGVVAGLSLALGGAPAQAEESFGSPELIAAAKAEGKLVLYTANYAEVEQDATRGGIVVSMMACLFGLSPQLSFSSRTAPLPSTNSNVGSASFPGNESEGPIARMITF